MCLIIIKPAGVPLPVYDDLDACYWSNPDGAGFMYREGKRVSISKGYFDLNEMLAELSSRCDVLDTEIVLHFRIATSGTVGVGNCHPYPVTNRENLLTAQEVKSKAGFAHNGILPNAWSKAELGRLSDTALFTRDCVSAVGGRGRQKMLETMAIASHSKFALMTPKDTKRFGEGWSEIDGCWFSNEYWYIGYYEMGKYEVVDYACPNCKAPGDMNEYNDGLECRVCYDCGHMWHDDSDLWEGVCYDCGGRAREIDGMFVCDCDTEEAN